MTQAQNTLAALLLEQNNAARKAGEPYLRGGKKTITSLVENVLDEDARAMAAEIREAAAREPEPGEAPSRMEFLLWDIYILNGRLPWEEMRAALMDLFQQTTPFYKAAQNKITNALPELFGTAMQMDLTGRAVGHVGKRKEQQVSFILENAADHELGTTARMLLDAFLIDFAESKRQTVRITLRKYAEMRNRDKGKNAIDALRRQVLADLYTLGDIRASYYERRNGRLEPTGYIRLNGGTGRIENGVIIWNWNTDILESLEKWAPIDYNRENLTADPRGSSYYFGRYIDVNYRRNEGKPGVERIKIRTLLEKTPNIPDMEKLKAQRGNIKERVIGRFFRDLDAIERVYYDVYTKDGTLVPDPLSMSPEEFIDGYLILDYSEYEKHTDRIKKRQKRAKKVKKAT